MTPVIEIAILAASTGFAALCFSAAIYLAERNEREARDTGLTYKEKEIRCHLCGHENEIVAPKALTSIKCGGCGNLVEIEE